MSLTTNSLENGTLTLLVVEGFTGSFGDDLDTNDDGTLEATPWVDLIDSVAVNDGGAGDLTYYGPALGPNFDGLDASEPGGASRIPDGVDTETTNDWVRNDFDLAGIPPAHRIARLRRGAKHAGGRSTRRSPSPAATR